MRCNFDAGCDSKPRVGHSRKLWVIARSIPEPGTLDGQSPSKYPNVRTIRADLSTNDGRQTACSILKKEVDALHVLANTFGGVNGTTDSVKSSDGIRTASRGIDEFEIPVLEASLRKQAFECILSRKEIGIANALCPCAIATG